MLERLADTNLLISIALFVFVAPAAFLAVVGVAAWRRQGGRTLGPALLALLSVTGGLSLGTLFLFADEPVLWGPLVLAAGAITIGSWRARRRVQTGWLLLGLGAPLLIAWSIVLLTPATTFVPDPLDDLLVPMWAALGGAMVLAGVSVVLRGDPAAPAPSMNAPAGQPGSRSIGVVAAAIRDPSVIGPFGMPEVAMLVTFVATWIIVPFALPRDVPGLVTIGLSSVVGAVLGTEAYLRAMTTRTRRAFEAFSWLGEWELARAKAITGGSVPSSPEEAEHWLQSRPEATAPAEDLPIRIEILLFAGRINDARRLVARLPTGTPWRAFEAAALRDLVEWRAGGDGELEGMRETAAEIQPRDGDDRLRAEVTIAVAKVRRLMAGPALKPDEAVRPFLEVRELLGRRADGQVGRALRPRIIPGLIVAGVVLGVVGEVLGTPL